MGRGGSPQTPAIQGDLPSLPPPPRVGSARKSTPWQGKKTSGHAQNPPSTTCSCRRRHNDAGQGFQTLATATWPVCMWPRGCYLMFRGLARSRSGVIKLSLAQRGATRTCFLRHATVHCRQQYSANEIFAHQNMHKGKHKNEGTGSQLKLCDAQCCFCEKNQQPYSTITIVPPKKQRFHPVSLTQQWIKKTV